VSFIVLLGVVAAVVLLCFAGIGLGIFLAGRRRIGACACDFDANRARTRHAKGGCEGPEGCARGPDGPAG
jgi:hypothetical protein